MEYITREEIQEVWEDLPDATWDSLADTLHYDSDLDNDLVQKLLRAIEYFESTGEPFPAHYETLYTKLNAYCKDQGFSIR